MHFASFSPRHAFFALFSFLFLFSRYAGTLSPLTFGEVRARARSRTEQVTLEGTPAKYPVLNYRRPGVNLRQEKGRESENMFVRDGNFLIFFLFFRLPLSSVFSFSLFLQLFEPALYNGRRLCASSSGCWLHPVTQSGCT